MTKDLKKGSTLVPSKVRLGKSNNPVVPSTAATPVRVSATPASSPKKATAIPTTVEPEIIVGESGATEAGSHTIMTGMGCGKEYQFETIRKIRKPLLQTPDHFAIGTQLHAGKARWFSKRFAMDNATWVSIQEAMREEMEREKLPVTLEALRKGERYMHEYMAYWSKMPRPSPVACEYKLGPTPLEAGDPFFVHRTARLDDVSRYPEASGALCLGETKTTSGTVNDCIKEYALHTQILLQMVLWKMDPKGEALHGPIKGVMLDIVAKSYDDKPSKFHRELIPVPEHALRWFPRTLKAHLRLLSIIDWDTDPVRNPTRCMRGSSKGRHACPYLELCLNGRKATALYVMGKGESLLSHKPVPGKMTMPWE